MVYLTPEGGKEDTVSKTQTLAKPPNNTTEVQKLAECILVSKGIKFCTEWLLQLSAKLKDPHLKIELKVSYYLQG